MVSVLTRPEAEATLAQDADVTLRHRLEFATAGTRFTDQEWAVTDLVAIERARDTFNEVLRLGYTAFEIKAGDRFGERVTSFNPETNTLIVAPLAGG